MSVGGEHGSVLMMISLTAGLLGLSGEKNNFNTVFFKHLQCISSYRSLWSFVASFSECLIQFVEFFFLFCGKLIELVKLQAQEFFYISTSKDTCNR